MSDYQLSCSTKPLWTTAVYAHQKSWKNDEIFEFSRKCSREFIILVDIFMFFIMLCIMSYWFVKFRCYIINKFNFEWLSAFVLDPTFVNNRCVCSLKIMKIMKFPKFHENVQENILELEIKIWGAPHEQFTAASTYRTAVK